MLGILNGPTTDPQSQKSWSVTAAWSVSFSSLKNCTATWTTIESALSRHAMLKTTSCQGFPTTYPFKSKRIIANVKYAPTSPGICFVLSGRLDPVELWRQHAEKTIRWSPRIIRKGNGTVAQIVKYNIGCRHCHEIMMWRRIVLMMMCGLCWIYRLDCLIAPRGAYLLYNPRTMR